ncbi:hypothetical protein [Janibacter terrae]
MTRSATLRAAASIVEAAAAREGHPHWQRIAVDLHEIADELAPPTEEEAT